VCCEEFNASTRAQIKCGFSNCDFAACKSCVRRYLLQSSLDPHCMSCKNMWGQEFIVMNLNRSFISKDYKNHRSQLLLEQEMSKMPGTIEAANRIKESEKEWEYASAIDVEIDLLKEQIVSLEKKKRQHIIKSDNLRNKTSTNKEKQKFIMPCPSETCRGFLTSQYKCQLCNIHTCPKCIEIIGTDKNQEHVCDEEKVKSAELIKKSTKPCPCCGTRISKISGCDQMWCTECKTAFSWNTGNIERGIVHNPHFYEYQKNLNDGIVPRNPGDVVCGGLCDPFYLRNVFGNGIKLKELKNSSEFVQLKKEIYSCHRECQHISIVVIAPLRTRLRPVDRNEDLRIDYILQKIDKSSLQAKLYKNDVTRKMETEQLHVYELWNETIIDLFAQITNIESKDQQFFDETVNILNQIYALKDYCNKLFANISVNYNRTTPFISTFTNHNTSDKPFTSWKLITQKSNKYKEKKLGLSDGLSASEN